MAERSMIDALLNQDKEYEYSMLWPWKTRPGMDPDQLSTDYMQGDMRPAVPGIIADFYNSMVKGGQMIQGDRPIDPDEITKIAAEFLPGALAAGRMAPKGAVLGANVFQGGPHRYGPEGASESLRHMSKGEGEQAYGWGRYDADLPEVARSYATQAPKSRWDLPGHLYKHDLPDEDIARYLDWDKPLSEQPESVRAAVAKLQGREPTGMNKITDETMGRDIESIARWITNDPNVSPSAELAAKNLGEAGIPGLKYYDGKSRNKPLKEIKESFLTELPEYADIDEVVELFGKGNFSPDNEEILKALAADDWLGFDSPAQAISAALGKNINNWEPSAGLIKAIAKAREGGTRNYVTWDQGVLDRMKLLERNGESMIDALR